MNTPTTDISKILDQLLRPLFDKHVRATTIINGVDLIRRLETYWKWISETNNSIMYIWYYRYIYTVLPQEESLDILTEFLRQHGYHKVQGVPIDAIRKLARIVIKANVFIYEKKFYWQIIGGAIGSAFTLTLANIFMWKWEKELVRRQLASNEIYGR